MSHQIELPIDRVFSTVGTEWHGLATPCEKIDDANMRELCPKIISGPMALNMGIKTDDYAALRKAAMSAVSKKNNEAGVVMTPDEWAQGVANAVLNLCPMPSYKALVADYREVRPDLLADECGGLVPLHIPKNSYGEIENGEVWELAKQSLAEVDAKVSCAGTLKAGKLFFISVNLGADGGKFEVTLPDGTKDAYLANLCFITSHDGTLGVEAYDSTVRICCANSLRWSREAAGEIGFKVYHTMNRKPAMANLPALVNRILTGRANFRDQMSYLASEEISQIDARKLFAGYFVQAALAMAVKDEAAYLLGSRTKNTLESLSVLFSKGIGCDGKTLYSALNAMTQHYTTGDGAGANADKLTKLCKANFGKAADHKTAFVNLLLSGPDAIKQAIAQGAKAIIDTGI